MLNSCEFIGNLGKDPEIRSSTTGTGASFTTFSIAVNKRSANREDKPMWINVSAFGKTGEFVGKYLKQGNQVFVRGTLELQEYEGKDGKNHVSIKLLANEVLSLTKKEEQAAASAVGAASAKNTTSDDIPF